MKYKLIFLLILFLSCEKKSEVSVSTNASELSINESILIQNLKIISHDSMQGREYLTEGNRKTRDFINKEFSKLELQSVVGTGYLQRFSVDSLSSGTNIIGKITGATAKTIVITAHYDHLGVVAGDIYNGADDNASGVSALIAIAAFYKKKLPNHTIVFAALDGEEVGLIGAQYLLNNYPSNVNDIVLNINLDMISRNDKNQLYASGTYHSPELKKILNQYYI
ncbi:hypothetical protein MNBD_BACTEROID03-2709 [hydrothermal vent metagenome]|uniref:Peptidase M28 domain-containing protein n=1 Tax=hydrothermal vent metagenome TaxID=652676 RepID=A0A3B0TDK4_9ZZZZ